MIVISLIALASIYAYAQTTEELKMTTYYPAPYGAYKALLLWPNDTPPACDGVDPAQQGVLHYDNGGPGGLAQEGFFYCSKNLAGVWGWQRSGGYWTHVDNSSLAGVPDFLLPADPAYLIGLGDITNPGLNSAGGYNTNVKLHIGEDGAGSKHYFYGPSFVLESSDSAALHVVGKYSTSHMSHIILSGVDVGINRHWLINAYGPSYGNRLGIGNKTSAATNFDPLLPNAASADEHLTILTAANGGHVGINTTTPSTQLEIASDAASVGSVGFGTARRDMWYDGGNDSNFWVMHTGANTGKTIFAWDDGAGGEVNLLALANDGAIGIGGEINPSDAINHPSGAHLTMGGAWTNSSSRKNKENINPLLLDDALKTVIDLEPVSYRNKLDGQEYVGFVAEDVPELVAEPDGESLSPMDIVAVLTKVVQHQQREIEELKAQIRGKKDLGL